MPHWWSSVLPASSSGDKTPESRSTSLPSSAESGVGDGDVPRRLEIVDLSRGGMKLLGAESLVTADTVEVAVDLGSGRLALTGRVVMSYPGPGGVRISHIAFSEELSAALGIIDDFVNRHLNDD